MRGGRAVRARGPAGGVLQGTGRASEVRRPGQVLPVGRSRTQIDPLLEIAAIAATQKILNS